MIPQPSWLAKDPVFAGPSADPFANPFADPAFADPAFADTSLMDPRRLLTDKAVAAATRRYAPQVPTVPTVPTELAGGFGPVYDAAVASGKFTPAQLQAAEASRLKYASTPLGLDAQQIGLASEGARATLAASATETRALATAQERADAAGSKAALVDDDQARQFESMRADFDASQARRLRDMDELRADIGKTKIDPAQYWAKGSGFGQVLSLLSVAIGGFQEGWSGGKIKNAGLEMLNQAIDRDIAAQRDNMSAKRATLADSQSVFAMARQKFGDDRAAEEFTRARQNEALKNVASRYQGEARTEGMRANAAKLEAHFGLEAQLADNRVRQLYAAAEAQRLRAAAGSAAYAASAEEREEERVADKKYKLDTRAAGLRKTQAEASKLENEVDGGGKGSEMMARYVPELGAVAGTPKQAEELNDQLALISQATQTLNTMKTLRLEGSTGGFGGDAARYDALRTDTIASMNRAGKLGALDQGTIDLFDKSIPKSAFLSFDANAAEALDTAIQTVATRRAAAIANTPLNDVTLEETERGSRLRYSRTSGAEANPKPVAPNRVTPKPGWSK